MAASTLGVLYVSIKEYLPLSMDWKAADIL